jgi:hypothetical protein
MFLVQRLKPVFPMVLVYAEVISAIWIVDYFLGQLRGRNGIFALLFCMTFVSPIFQLARKRLFPANSSTSDLVPND